MYHASYSPASSPQSSPSIGAQDSSPPSSPWPSRLSLDSVEDTEALPHPFAASSRADRAPPQYTLRRRAETDIFSDATNQPRATLVETSIVTDEREVVEVPLAKGNLEEQIWNDEIARVFDKGEAYIDLHDHRLTYIPRDIVELKNYVGTEDGPAAPTNDRRTFQRTATPPAGVALSSSRRNRSELHLNLAKNEITRIPPELFRLENLTVLLLRHNNLAFLPPEIRCLTNLRELNVAFNNLKYIPAEMMDMSIDTLLVHPNPWLDPPPAKTRVLGRTSTEYRFSSKDPAAKVISPTNTLSVVPPLVELMFRRLVVPFEDDPSRTFLEAVYGSLDPARWRLSPSLQAQFNACVPGSVATPALVPAPVSRAMGKVRSQDITLREEVTGIGICRSPRHSEPVRFGQAAEERFTWEQQVAGKSAGGAVPVRWRGCSRGCLDHLDPERKPDVQPLAVPSLATDVDTDVDMDSEDDDDGAVRPVNAASGFTHFDD